MTTFVSPVSALTMAVAHADSAARQVLPLISATLHAQFPAGAYLVLTRPADFFGTGLYLDSVRDAEGQVLRHLAQWEDGNIQLGDVPPELAAQWEDLDPRDPIDVGRLIDRLNAQVPDGLFDVLPEEVMNGREPDAEDTPLGFPLAPLDAPRCAMCFRLVSVHAGRICERPDMKYC